MNTSQPRGTFTQTHSGKAFYPIDPDPAAIDIADIAHSLSMQCRYNGHCQHFYSVAEHCVLLAAAAPPVHALWALLHDAAEAYVGDVVRPLKSALPGFAAIEDRVMATIARRYGLPGDAMPPEVAELDDRILHDERAQNMAPSPIDWNLRGGPLGLTLQFWNPVEARVMFLNTFHQLTEGKFR